MESKNLRAGSNKSRKSAIVKNDMPDNDEVKYIRHDEKIDVEIRDIIRIKPRDFDALKNSFEGWAKQWE